MKLVRFVFKAILWLVVILFVALLAMPLWFGPVVKTAANALVPGIVKTDFRLGHVALNPYTVRFELGDLALGNPSGYPVKEAVKVGEVVFDAETMSLLTDVVHVEEVSVRDIFVSVVNGGENSVLNFKQIQYNVAGGKEKYEAAQSAKEAKTASADDGMTSEAKPEEKRPSKKVVIDRVEISGLKLHLGFIQVPLPPLTLKDIGRKSGGCTMAEAWEQVVAAVLKSAGVAGDQLKALQVLTGDASKRVNEAVSRATAEAQTVLGDTSKRVSATATAVVGETAGKATAAVGETAGKTIGTANEAVGAGAKALGDGAKKAVESLKGLW